jgi:hypothetical protein
MKAILFCLEECTKCVTVKELVKDNDNIKVITLEKEGPEVWGYEEGLLVKKYRVLEDLQKTAPILVLEDYTKFIGQLRIMKWLQHNNPVHNYKSAAGDAQII